MILLYGMIVTLVVVGSGVVGLLGYVAYSIWQEYRHDRVPALLYHQFVSKVMADKGKVLNTERVYVSYDTVFEEQMAYLHREGYSTITLDEYMNYRRGLSPLPAKPVLLTFDDGFMSNYQYAFPILKKYNQRATIFVTPDKKSKNFKKYAAVDSPLTEEQIVEMSQYGIAIESHGMTHRYLTDLPKDVVRWELEESKQVLENITGKSVKYLAVPSGAYNSVVKAVAKHAGYQAVFCMLKGSNNGDSDVFALRRMVVARDFTMEDFKNVLSPKTAVHLRISSCAQNVLLSVLGPGGLDRFRNWLYRSPFGEFMVRGQMRYFAGGVFFLGVATVILGIVFLVT